MWGENQHTRFKDAKTDQKSLYKAIKKGRCIRMSFFGVRQWERLYDETEREQRQGGTSAPSLKPLTTLLPWAHPSLLMIKIPTQARYLFLYHPSLRLFPLLFMFFLCWSWDLLVCLFVIFTAQIATSSGLCRKDRIFIVNDFLTAESEHISAHLHRQTEQSPNSPSISSFSHHPLFRRPQGGRLNMWPDISSTDHLGGLWRSCCQGIPWCVADLFPNLAVIWHAALPRLVLLAEETWAGCSLWSEGRQEEATCGKFIIVEKHLHHVAAVWHIVSLNHPIIWAPTCIRLPVWDLVLLSAVINCMHFSMSPRFIASHL